MPVIHANYQKKALKAAFVRTYSDLNNIAKKYYAENGISFSEAADNSKNKSIGEILEKLMSYLNTSGQVTSKVWDTSSSNYSEIDKMYNLKTLAGTTASNICDVTSTKADLSGRLFTMNDKPDAGENGPIVCVDVNGLKNPNKYGVDFFLFIFTLDNTVIPMGMEHKNNTQNTEIGHNFFFPSDGRCKKNGSGYAYNFGCAYYALLDKHPENSNKSYWEDFI